VSRALPCNLEAEQAVLGSLLVQNAAMDAIGATLRAEHFYRKAHGQVFSAIVALLERGIAADFVTVKEELTRRGELEAVGGPVYLAELSTGVPRATNVEYYARIVREKSMLRRLIEASDDVTERAYKAGEDAHEVLSAAEAVFLNISQEAVPGELVMSEVLAFETHAVLDTAHRERRPLTGLSSGFPGLDGYTRGMHKGNLIVLGGRPGEGKSSLALQIGLHVAKKEPVALFSMEMSREEISTRAIAMLGQVDHHFMMLGRLGPDDRQRMDDGAAKYQKRLLGIDDSSALTPMQIRSKARRMKARIGLALVVVDYLQLMQRPKHAKSREEAVAENSRALKVLAGELGVPVLALSQLNRAVESRADKRPTLADLRESGAIEQDANAVLLIYRQPTKSDGAVSEAPPVELIVAKQRNGPSNVTVPLTFRGETTTFAEVEWR
jgi:replicative DNA helicase